MYYVYYKIKIAVNTKNHYKTKNNHHKKPQKSYMGEFDGFEVEPYVSLVGDVMQQGQLHWTSAQAPRLCYSSVPWVVCRLIYFKGYDGLEDFKNAYFNYIKSKHWENETLNQ